MALTASNSAGYEAPVGVVAEPVVFTVDEERLKVLVAPRINEPARGVLALPGGFVGRTERPRETAQRKLREKTGLVADYVEQLRHSADDEDADPRGWLIRLAYLALVPASARPEDSDAQWHPVDELPALAFDHAELVAYGAQRLRWKAWESNIVLGLLPERFTLSEARCTYEAIAGESYDPANFRRAFRAAFEEAGMVEPTGDKRAEGPGRPAALWRWAIRDPAWARPTRI